MFHFASIILCIFFVNTQGINQKLFDKLPDVKKEIIVNKAKEFVENAESNSKNNFSKLSEKSGYKFLKAIISPPK